VKLNTHYYVLSLSRQTSRLYEAFRDTFIDIQNTGFPINSSASSAGASRTVDPALRDGQLREFICTADQHFDHYFGQDPLRLVVVGEKTLLSIFRSVTSHEHALIGMVEGDYAVTSPHDLGKIVWPVVKEAMAGTSEKAMRELETAERTQNVASGIGAVVHLAGSGVGGTLFVEEDYHMKGGVRGRDHSLIRAEDLDIREVTDDAVDAIIEQVLGKGGNVVFLESGSLTKFQKIALIKTG
jgi:hypothetical protein